MADNDIRAPIQRRLERLRAQWREFAEDPEARLLHWVLAHDEWNLLETFFQVEDHESGVTPDLFLRLTAPFDEPERHGLDVVESLSEQYASIRGELAAAGADASWTAPAPTRGQDDVDAFLDAAASFHAHHQPLFRHLVLVLLPEGGMPAQAWEQWVERVVRRAHEPNVRLVCIDSREAPILTEVARTQAHRVRTCVADLDMGAALEEVSTAAGRLDTPYGRYRHLYVQLGRALAAKELGRAERLAGEAAALAHQQKWGHLLVASWFALGAGYLAMGKPVEAIRTYWQAEEAALEAQARGESSALALRLKVRLALGAALVSAAVYERGATVYEETAPLAEQLQDTRMLLECWRMAAYCHELARATDASWRCSIEGLKVAQRMDDETRRSSTLGYLGEGLLRLTRTWTYRDHGEAIARRMEKLLGPRWRPSDSGGKPS
ncbi:hypothetical protein D187_000184 [Cystobacter fuscus DSM 2262]|uniref:MalT-like TPR region domain-containing protein n=1 Tax=Cystobacter fuscus (strain ATCC 25194 / DSM 2262 / NBRC 100088 / M29) TaxID=1242864 RepID=S9PQI9_CYSF2|nr:hypothetical protein [Cystobacter fuscus]EPX64762.1 hypothetical protein D187_000184 [Cystobacter fuscus DSM 2262]